MVHIVQIGFDTDVFSSNAYQDSLDRQLRYARILEAKVPGSRMTNMVVTDKSYSFDSITFDNLKLIPITSYRIRHIPALTYYLLSYYKHDKYNLITTQDIHGLCWGGVAASKYLNIPVIGQIHYDLSSPLARNDTINASPIPFYDRISNYGMYRYSGFRVVCNASRVYLEKLGVKTPIGVHPVPPSLAEDHIQHDKLKWPKNGGLRVLFVGRLASVKNLDLWIDTARKVVETRKDVYFTIIGEGEERERITRSIEENNLTSNIKIIGGQTPSELVSWYKQSDVLLLTSHYEGFGRVLVEGMSHGVVPISVDLGGPRDIIEHGNSGYLVEKNPNVLADKVIALSMDRALLEEMSLKSQERVKNKYRTSTLSNNWINFLLSFLENNS